MSTRFVGLVTVGLIALPLVAACSSEDDSKPAPAATVSKSEHQRLYHVTAQGKHYCADVKAGHKHPGAVHLTNCGRQKFVLTFAGQKKPKTIEPGKKVWVKSPEGTYHGFALTLMGSDNTVVGLFTME